MTDIVLERGVERPSVRMWLLDRSTGALVDLSSGYTFSFKIGVVGQTAMFTKTTNITGAAGSGVEPTGTPNVTLDFVAGELDSLVPGNWKWQLDATTSSLNRQWKGTVRVEGVIS